MLSINKAKDISINIEEKTIQAWALISKELARARISFNNLNTIRFVFEAEIIEAHHSKIFSSQRNTVIAKNNKFICLTEHFLAACALMKINGIDLELSQGELPFADGSSMLWYDFFNSINLKTESDFKKLSLDHELIIEDENDNSRSIKIIPAEKFKLEYRLDYQRPFSMQYDFIWDESMDILDVLKARTFSGLQENKMLGYQDWVLGMDETGFDQELHFKDEPARHKALDLVGDLMLSGFNPLRLNAHIISNKGGHDLNAKAAKKLSEYFGSSM